jgi:hypothetical protein
VDNVAGAGMVMNGFVVKNCRFGVFYSAAGLRNRGSLTFLRADISATEEAVTVENPLANVSFMSSTIRRGDVVIKGGWLTMLDTKVNTTVTLKQGTQMAAFAATTTTNGSKIKLNNEAYCPLWQEAKNPMTEEQPVIPREDGLYSHHRASSKAVTVANLDNTGVTDVSEELNALLNMDKKEPEIMDAEPDDTVRPPSRPSQQMER